MSDRYVLVSSDGHAGTQWENLRNYMDPAFRPDFDEWLAAYQAYLAAGNTMTGVKLDPAGKANRERYANEQAVKEGGRDGTWNPDVRVRELDREGVAAEIVFMDFTNRNALPFGFWVDTMRGQGIYSVEQNWAATRAHNRWLAELAATNPGRHFGVALILPHDVEAAVAELRWARKAGIAGGFALPNMSILNNDPELFWNHPRYEPIWATAAELRLPLQLHVGGRMPNYGGNPGERWINSTEIFWTTRRPLWFLMWSGVLERHPAFRIAITESGGAWAAAELDLMDYLYDVRNPEEARRMMPRRPREYWVLQCGIGVSPPAGRSVIDLRRTIGIETIMWGSDYPHHEGTWPQSINRLKELFTGVPVPEVRKMVGENAARLCGMDLKKLEAIAARIGPPLTEFGAVETREVAA